MLFPTTIEDTVAPPVIIENKGKQRAKSVGSINSKLLVLMKEMREEMRIRDERLKEELRWRDSNQVAENKKIKENLASLIQQRDEQWKEELAQRDRALRAELKEGKGFCK